MLALVATSCSAWSFNLGAQRPAASRAAVAAPKAPVAMVVSEMEGKVVPIDAKPRKVPLTGDTLQAALKMRCDNSGAAYAIYWANVRGELKAVADYNAASYKAELSARGLTQSFADASLSYVLTADGAGPVARVLQTGELEVVEDAQGDSRLKRRELATKYGVTKMAFAPFEDGVVEFGTTAPMPKETIRRAFEELGALYVLYWKKSADGNEFR